MKKSTQGFGLIEIIIGAAIVMVTIMGMTRSSGYGLQATKRISDQQRAGFLISEGVEALRLIRDDSFANLSGLSTGTTYYLYYNNTINKWKATTTPQVVDTIFYRYFTVANVNRDSNDDITSSGGTLDTGTRKIHLEVAWRLLDATSTKTQDFYLSDI